MALVKPTLKAAIKAAFLQEQANETDKAAAIDNIAGAIADAVDAYLKSMTITYTLGLVAPAGGGPVTGAFANIIS